MEPQEGPSRHSFCLVRCWQFQSATLIGRLKVACCWFVAMLATGAHVFRPRSASHRVSGRNRHRLSWNRNLRALLTPKSLEMSILVVSLRRPPSHVQKRLLHSLFTCLLIFYENTSVTYYCLCSGKGERDTLKCSPSLCTHPAMLLQLLLLKLLLPHGK